MESQSSQGHSEPESGHSDSGLQRTHSGAGAPRKSQWKAATNKLSSVARYAKVRVCIIIQINFVKKVSRTKLIVQRGQVCEGKSCILYNLK